MQGARVCLSLSLSMAHDSENKKQGVKMYEGVKLWEFPRSKAPS